MSLDMEPVRVVYLHLNIPFIGRSLSDCLRCKQQRNVFINKWGLNNCKRFSYIQHERFKENCLSFSISVHLKGCTFPLKSQLTFYGKQEAKYMKIKSVSPRTHLRIKLFTLNGMIKRLTWFAGVLFKHFLR